MIPFDKIDVTTKAKVLLEALPYIQRFKDSIFVIKYGGAFMDDPDPVKRARIATDLVFLSAVGIKVVVVHGGGKAISRAMEAAQLPPKWNNGMRVTDAETVNIVEKTLNEQVNLEICEMLQAQGGRPRGMPGNTVLLGEKLTEDEEGNPIDIGFVGRINAVKTKLIKKAISDGYMPIVSPITLDENGQAYNTNADVAASHVAASLRARRLIYLCDVPGLLADPEDPESLISTLPVKDVKPLRDRGIIGSGMRPKVDSAVKALSSGVHRVHFVDARQPHSLLLEIFTDRGVGTEIVNG